MAKKKKRETVRKKVNRKVLLLVTVFSTILLAVSTYAWLSASLNVKVKFFDLVVATDKGLFISLDGVEFSDSVEISLDSLITNLGTTYPTNTNQWASGGLWPVSSNGIVTTNDDKYAVYAGEVSKYRLKRRGRKFLNTTLIDESKPNANNIFISFDLFLKNVSGSPKPDNLYFDDGTGIEFEDDVSEDIRESMTNVMNSMRLGMVKIGSVSSKATVNQIQNIKCNNTCKALIYEPNKLKHSTLSIEKAAELNVTLTDGVYDPTYSVIAKGSFLEHTNGHEGTGIPLDTEHFKLQDTITDTEFGEPLFDIPNGITKVRVYVWIEGQDMDSLETSSKGAPVYVALNFEKDLAGYE